MHPVEDAAAPRRGGARRERRLQQATLAIRAHVPLDVLRDTIRPFPTFSELYVGALEALRVRIAAERRPLAVSAR